MYGCGIVFGKVLCIIVAVEYFFLAWLDWWWPRDQIDLAPTINLETLNEVRF